MTLRAWAIVILSAFFAALLETSFMPFLPSPWQEIRPVTQIIVLFIVLNRPRGALVAAAISGFVMDLFAVTGSGFAFGRLLLIAALILLVSERILTNRSVYATVALMLLARVIDRLWLILASVLGGALFRWDLRLEDWSSFGLVIAWDIGLISLAFIGFALFTRRFLISVGRGRRLYG